MFYRYGFINTSRIFNERYYYHVLDETPIVGFGDFNNYPEHNGYLVDFMKNEFGINYVTTESSTLGNTIIDCRLTRNFDVDIKSYVP